MDCTNYKSIRRRISIMIIVFMIFTLTQGYQNSFGDNIVSTNTDAVKVSAYFINGGDENPTQEIKVRSGYFVQLKVNYNILSRSDIKPGDTITIKLPKIFQNTTIEYKKEHFSKCVVNGDLVTLTFGENINEGVQGYFTLTMEGNDKIKDGQKYEAIITAGNQTAKASVIGQVVQGGGGSSPDIYKVFGSGFPVNNETGQGIINDINKPVPYTIVVNRDRKNLGTMTINDTIPKGMALDTKSLEIYEISPQNDYKDVTSLYLNSGRVNMNNESLKIIFDPGKVYYVDYNTYITGIEDKYTNEVSMQDINGKEAANPLTAKFGAGAGAINVYKTVDKDHISNFGNQNIVYHIKFSSYGTFLKGTMDIKDKLNPKLTDIKITSTNQFTIKYDPNTKILEAINDKSTIEPGANAEITINASMKEALPGEKITNTATVNGANTDTVSTIKNPLIELSKVGTDAPNKLLSGAEFEVINATNNERVKNIVTENGEVDTLSTTTNPLKFELPYGDYKLVEVKAPNGYAINKKPINFSVNKDSTVINLTAKDNPVGNIKIVKTNNSKEPLQGAKFNLVQDGEIIESGETNDQGILEFNNIEVGNYQLIEVSAPKGYQVAKDVSVTVNKEQTNTVNIVDPNILGTLNITKVGSDGAKLQGAEFTITGANGYKQVVTTDVQGVATLNNIPWGTYTVKETKAPIGYALNSKEQTVTIDANNVSKVQNLTFNDTKILGNLVITKTDESGNTLSGAEFTVTGPNSFKKVVTTDSKGIANLTDLEWGTYTVQETKAPEGYKLDSNPQTVEVTNATVGQSQNLTFKDNKILGSLSITKVGDSGAKLEGAEFTITGPDNFNKVMTTDKEGLINLNNLAWGEYKIKETKAPQGYKLNPEVQTVTISATNSEQKQNVTVVDGEETGNLVITKEGPDKEKLSGATLEITGPNDFNKTVITGNDGTIAVNGLAWGKYVVKEIKAPEGYNLDETPQTIEITSSNVTTTQKLTFKDSKKEGTLNITKVGSDGAKLQGAEFTIIGANGYKQVVTTDVQGVATLNNIPWGTYTVKETKAPIGYALNSKEQTVTIDANNVSKVQNLTFNDTKILGNLVITKTDESRNTLSGAEFTVTGPNSFKKVVTTDSKGIANLNDLEWGTYIVQETKAPEGYKLDSNPQTVQVTNVTVGQPQNLVFKNNKILGSLSITKTDESGNTLSGAEFTVTGPNGFKKVVTTDSKGIANLDNLQWGTYTVQETRPPQGYKINSEIKTVIFNETKVEEKIGIKDAVIPKNENLNNNNNSNNGEKINSNEKVHNNKSQNNGSNPETGDNWPVVEIIILIVAIAGLLIMRNTKKEKTKKIK